MIHLEPSIPLLNLEGKEWRSTPLPPKEVMPQNKTQPPLLVSPLPFPLDSNPLPTIISSPTIISKLDPPPPLLLTVIYAFRLRLRLRLRLDP